MAITPESVGDQNPVQGFLLIVHPVGLALPDFSVAAWNPKVYDAPTSGNAGGSFYGRGARGTTRFLVDEHGGVLIGVTITGSEVADFLHAATIAVVAAVPLTTLRHAVPAFPTRSEIWLKLDA